MWWLCKNARNFWAEMYRDLSTFFKNSIPYTLELFLLGLNLEKIDYTDRISLWYLLTTARLQYAKYWKQEKVPTISKWLQKNASNRNGQVNKK